MSKFILVGMSGSGKTTIGKSVAEKTNLKFIDLDAVIEEKYGKISDIFNEAGEGRFREYESREFMTALEMEDIVISTGGGILGIKPNREAAKKGTVIFIDRDIDKIKASIDESNRPMVRNKPGMLEKLYKERYGIYRESMDFTVFNNGSVSECIDSVIDVINKIKYGV
ncbi:MAG: shikimate kinase [Clostridia bacterium]|nr:shikimate kinase [Clostridia bacterium]MBN2882347.1 shikimate kinase [Clostridia bacterium]